MPKFVVSPARLSTFFELSRFVVATDAAKLSFLRYQSGEITKIAVRQWKRQVWLRPASSDLPVLRKILVDREYAPPPELAPPATILDAGAYLGYSALFFHFCFPAARILALEPDPENFRLLRKNTASIPNITAINSALWSSATPQAFTADAGEPWASRVASASSPNEQRVPCMTLADAAARMGGSIDLMKVDIEGGEADAFKSVPPAVLSGLKAVVIEFHERFYPGSSASFLNAIEARPHRTFVQGENSWFIFD